MFENEGEPSKETSVCIKGQDYLVSLNLTSAVQQRWTYNQYTVLDEPPLSQTPFTSIHVCQFNQTFQRFVMKQLKRGYMRKVDREAYLNSMREIDIHKQLRHTNIINLIEIIDDSQDDKVYLIMELAERGQIMTHEEGKFSPTRPGAEFLSESEIRNYCKQLVGAVAELHSKKIMHLDLKP